MTRPPTIASLTAPLIKPTTTTLIANSGLWLYSMDDSRALHVSVGNDLDPLIESTTGNVNLLNGTLTFETGPVGGDWEIFVPEVDRASSEMVAELTQPFPVGGYPCYWQRCAPVVNLRGYFSVTCSGTLDNHFAINLPFTCPDYPQAVTVVAIVPMTRKQASNVMSGMVTGSRLDFLASIEFLPLNEMCFAGILSLA